MKKLFVFLLTVVLLIPCGASGIDIRKEGTVQYNTAAKLDARILLK